MRSVKLSVLAVAVILAVTAIPALAANDSTVGQFVQEMKQRLAQRIGDGGDETTITEDSSTPFSFRRVDNLPSISADTPEIVIWNSPNGDDDMWVSKPGTPYWAPLAHFSNLNGTP